MQLFNVSYAEITRKMPELAEAGYTSLWLPPPTKGSGGLSVGYDLWDPFDLGSKDQRGSVSTRYGTEAQLLRMIETAHRFGIRVYFDNIMNHRAFDVPGYNEDTAIDIYPGMVPEDFHLRKTEDGFYRKWDNTRDWGSSWQVQNLGLADLIDIAHETPNANHGTSEGSTHPKYSFIRDLERPEQYDKDKDGNTQYFGVLIDQARAEYIAGGTNNPTAEQLRLKARDYVLANPGAFTEDVGAYLIRAARWKINRTKADGLRLDAVKHVPDYFFGQQSGAGKDGSNAGYLGGVQWQFNITRGFSDWDNHRDSVFEDKRGRDDAMVFGEHLGQPPGYGGYWDAGMRLVDNDLRSKLNNTLGNPGATLAGLDAPGAGGFAANLGVTHANSHDSDFAAQKEWQHAYYMTREGMGLIYSDGYYKAETLGESGGAFPRHANTQFLGQFADPRIPNILKIHNDFARGLQEGRWSDGDYLAFERRDNRDKFGNTRSGTAADEITMVMMMNDNTAQGQARSIATSFPNGAYLYQYAEGPNGSFMTGFYKYGGELNSVIVPPGGYYVFSYRTPELSTLWPQAAVTFYQNGIEASRITVTRKDGPDGDISFNPYGLSNRGYPNGTTPDDYSYQTTIPVVKSGPVTILARADGSAENIRLKLNGGVDLNGSGSQPANRDFPPGLYSDIWLGYEQPLFVDRQHPEKFAAKDTVRCQIGSPGAETYVKVLGGALTINNGPTNANNYGTESGNQASWVYHDPDANVGGIASPPKQLDDAGTNFTIWVKSNPVGSGFKGFLYYTLDGTYPEGAGGIGRGNTRVAEINYRHGENGDDWWSTAALPRPANSVTFTYKIGFHKTGASSWWPSGPTEVAYKKRMLTTFRVTDFNPATAEFFPHNDYARIPTLGQDYTNWPWAMQVGLPEGFHVVRARAFLNRNEDTQAALYQTFVQPFYYDAVTPGGQLMFPANNGDEMGGSSYDMVIRTDFTVDEVWVHIADSDPGNNDSATRQINGNGTGFEPFEDDNGNNQRDPGEKFTDLDGNGTYTTNLVQGWGQATEVSPSSNIVNTNYMKEWRFRYVNIPATSNATISIRLLEASSSRNMTLSPTNAHVTELTRTVNTRGPDQRVNIAWPQNDGDRVDDNYTMKVYFTKSLADGTDSTSLKNRFTLSIASTESGSPRDPVAQTRDNFTINYDIDSQYHELAIPLPNLYNDVADFLHTLIVTYTFPDARTIDAFRMVKANPSTRPFVRITRPTELGSDGRQTEIILPDVPGTDQLDYVVRVETSTNVTDLVLTGNPSIILFEEPFTDLNGNGRWDDIEPTSDTNTNGVWDAPEPFVDLNTNGVWDAGETFTDLAPTNWLWDAGEVYVDLNTNGVFDAGENFFDINTNGVRDAAEPFTDGNANGVRDGVNVSINGKVKVWDYTWRINAPGNYQLKATATLNAQVTETYRNARVILREIVDADGIADNDDDHDGLNDLTETNKEDLPAGNAETWNNGDVHIWYASGRTIPTSPDSDGDLLPDALEVGWRTASSPPTDTAVDTNGDGYKNFIGDLDPPLYAVVENHPAVPGVGSQSQGDSRTRQAAGSVTDPTNPDTDGDGIPDGVEDANRNGWTDGDGKPLPLTATIAQYQTARPNTGDWPNNIIESFETWTETSPTKADSDGDGLVDGYGEDKNFNGRIDGDTNSNRVHNAGELWTETDPLNDDTDGDGLPDGWESTYSLDPLDNGTFSYRFDGAGSVDNGPAGDPDGDGFSNAQELASGTNPRRNDLVPPTAGEGTINIGSFADWNHRDLLVLDEYNEGGSQGADVYRSWNSTDNSRDIVAFSMRDGGDVSAGGDGLVYFRIDFLDLEANAWEGEVDAYVVIDTGNPAVGERSIPNEVDIATDMRWEVIVAAYNNNFGSIFVDLNPAQNTTTQYQNPLTEGGVEARGFDGNLNQVAWSSLYDAVEIGIERRHLVDAGWLGNISNLNFQVFTTKPNTTGAGTGDIGGRNDIRDTIYDDWLASDYWKDQDNIILNGKLSGYFGRSGANDRNKNAKVMLLAHGNQSIQPASVMQSLVQNGNNGYQRLLKIHEDYNAPLTMHITPSMASALQWAVNPSAGATNDGAALNARIRALVATNRIDLVGSTFADHVVKYFPQSFNNDNKALSDQFLNTIYGSGAASPDVFWSSERVLDAEALTQIGGMGYDFTFADQMRHLVKWFGRTSALGTGGYQINQVNGIKLFPIHDVTSDYLDQVLDSGSSMPVRQLLSRRARGGVQNQVVVLWRDMGDFQNGTKADAYEANVRWLGGRPWIRVVTANQIAAEEIAYVGMDGNIYYNWGSVDRGTGITLEQSAKDWVDWATTENYDNWYTRLATNRFGSATNFGRVGQSGHAHTAWSSVTNLASSNLTQLARSVIGGAMFQTAFHFPAQSTDLSKFSTGDYITPASQSGQALADFARYAQAQTRHAAIYARVQQWASTANAATLGSEAADVDLDGANEYMLYNRRVFALFEARGGRMTAAWLRSDAGKVWQVAGNFASYANTDTEDEGASNDIISGGTTNVLAFRTSGFKDWWVITGVNGSNAHVNATYSVGSATGKTGWVFSYGGVTKEISLPSAAEGKLTAAYTMNGPNRMYVRFGLSPNLLDLMMHGHQHLEVEQASATNLHLLNNASDGPLRAFVRTAAGSTVNQGASDQSAGMTTYNRRNQAQTEQVEIEITGNTVITLGFEELITLNDGVPVSWLADNGYASDVNVNTTMSSNGVNTLLESYIAGLDPNNPDSVVEATSSAVNTNGLTITFATVTGRLYTVEYVVRLTNQTWSLVNNLPPGQSNPVAGNGDIRTVTDRDAPTSTNRYYRFKVELENQP